jgi:hypothetical protein
MVAVRWVYVYTWITKNKVMLLFSLEEKYLIGRFRTFNYARVLVQVWIDSIQFDSRRLNKGSFSRREKNDFVQTHM